MRVKATLSLDMDVYTDLKINAVKQHKTMSAIVEKLILEYLEKEKIKERNKELEE